MKSLILGAFILSLFFAVAQSISLSQYTPRSAYKKDKQNETAGNITDSSTIYVIRGAAKADGPQLAVTALSR